MLKCRRPTTRRNKQFRLVSLPYCLGRANLQYGMEWQISKFEIFISQLGWSNIFFGGSSRKTGNAKQSTGKKLIQQQVRKEILDIFEITWEANRLVWRTSLQYERTSQKNPISLNKAVNAFFRQNAKQKVGRHQIRGDHQVHQQCGYWGSAGVVADE